MSRANYIQVFNFKDPKYSSKGIFEPWVKYAKRIKTLEYRLTFGDLNFNLNISPNAFTNSSKFLRLLRYQPRLKDLTIKYVYGSQVLSEKYWKFENYPATLERLTLKDPIFQNHPTSLTHLKNLKHLGITFFQIQTGQFTCFCAAIPLKYFFKSPKFEF